MDRQRWQRLWDHFHDALERRPEERTAYLEGACEDDALRAEVERMLAAHATTGAPVLPTSPDLAPVFDGARPAASLLGTTIGPYRLERVLGEGGMGVVYEAAQDEPIRRSVALKVIRQGMESREAVARFEAERQALAAMSHPDIATVHDAGLTRDGRPYFVMERVEGVPITQYAERERLDLRHRVELFVRICRAVEHAHRRGILHRDLKPANLLVSISETGAQPKVIDFGVAKATGGDACGDALETRAGRLIGTPEYMSPEQAAMSADIDTRADVYSLGVCLYELLTGELPFDFRGTPYPEVERALREREPERPSRRASSAAPGADELQHGRAERARALRGDLDWIVLRALEKDRARRYGSAAALADDLARYLRDEPVAAGPPSAGYRLRKFARRHRVGVAASLALAVALLAGVAATSRMAWIAERERRAAVREAEVSLAVRGFLERMLAAADPRGDAAIAMVPREVRVAEVLDHAARGLDAGFDGPTEVEAALRQVLGRTYRGLGLADQAEPQLERAVALREASAEGNEAAAIEAGLELAGLRLDQGRYEEAEARLRALATRAQGRLGGSDPLTLRAASQLNDALFEQGKVEEAVALYRETLERCRRELGERHPVTLQVLHNLGAVLNRKGEPQAAIAVYREAVAGHEAAFGAEHPNTLQAVGNLAAAVLAGGELGEAERLLRRAETGLVRTLGAEHADTLRTRNNLGAVLWRQGRLGEAGEIWSQVLAGYRKTLGPDHPLVLVTTANIARVTQDLGRLDEAERLYRDLVARAERTLPPGHFNLHLYRGGLGVCLMERGAYDEAERWLLESHRGHLAAHGAQHPRSAQSIERLVDLYERWGRTREAARFRALLPVSGASAAGSG